jgi:hypothetical protein
MTGGVLPPGSEEFSMRKALIGLILAATAMVPAAASAQRHHNDGDGERAVWSGRNNNSDGNRGNGGENRAARYEARQEARQQQQAQQQQQQVQVVERQRGDGGNRGGWNRGGNNGGGDRGQWRGGDNSNGGQSRNNDNGGNRGQWRGRNNQQSIYPQAWQGDPNDPRLQHYRELERRNQNGGYRRGDGDRRDWRNDRNDRNDRNWRGDRRGDRNGRDNWNRGWRNDNRYNWSSWRNQNRYRYHLSPYYAPYRNWRYQRFSIGLFLDSLFYDQRYWISDPYEYRLPPAPYGTQWVRYYDDVILVDIYTGEVIDVIYDFFW